VVVGIEADVLEIVVLATSADALLSVRRPGVAAGDGPGPLGTNWFMPAFVNRRFGESGRRLEEGTIVCPFDL